VRKKYKALVADFSFQFGGLVAKHARESDLNPLHSLKREDICGKKLKTLRKGMGKASKC